MARRRIQRFMKGSVVAIVAGMLWLAAGAAVALLALSWLTGGERGWGMGVPLFAVTTCPVSYVRGLAVLAVGLGLAAAASRLRSRLAGPALLVAFAGLAWALRERNFLLGDSRVWLENARRFGTGHRPLSRAGNAQDRGVPEQSGHRPRRAKGAARRPLRVRGSGRGPGRGARVAAGSFRGGSPPPWSSCSCRPWGFCTTDTWRRIPSSPPSSLGPSWRWARTPRGAGRARSPSPSSSCCRSCTTWRCSSWCRLRGGWPRGGGRVPGAGWGGGAVALAAPGRGGASRSSARAFSVLSTSWDVRRGLSSYLEDVANGWFLVLVPVGVLAWAGRRRALASSYGKFLALTAVIYLFFPLGARFDLGVYRDFGLLGPASMAVTLFAAHGLDPARPRRVLWTGLAGAPLLAGWLALGVCDGGAAFVETQIARPEIAPGARAYSYEVLAFERHGAGDPAGALRAMERAVRATPGNARLYGPLGEFQLDVGDTAAAIHNLERSLETRRAFKTLATLLPLLVQRGDLEHALDLASRHRDDVLVTSQAAAAVSVAYLRMGYADSTVLVSQERLGHDPEDHVAFFNAGAGLAALGRLEDAEGAFREAARLAPGNAAYHRAVIAVLRRLPGGTEAISAYLRGLPPALADSLWTGP